MANRKSPAAQAIKDMLEMGIDITCFTGNVNKIHEMNAEISIITKEKTVKKVVKTKIEIKVTISNYMVPEALKPAPRRVLMINPDGTIATGMDWDRD